MTFQRTYRVYEQAGLHELGDGWIRPGGAALTERAVALSGLAPGSMVLDLGCGTGATVRQLVDRCRFRAVGVDPSEVLLGQGRRKDPRLPVARAWGERLPFGDGLMDGVLAECSLSLTRDVNGVMEECFRVLKGGGMFLLHDVYARSPDAPAAPSAASMPVECCLTGAVSRNEWAARLERAGLRVLAWEDHSQALKEFAARIIFAYGSLEAFWCRARNAEQSEEARETSRAVINARPGYFLMIARKP